MKVYVIYKYESDHARPVLDYLRDFERRTSRKLEVIDPETREGDTFCRTYDIVEYPTIIATDSNGILQRQWRGLPLPTIDEVSYYTQ
jgi:hypothetical protein